MTINNRQQATKTLQQILADISKNWTNLSKQTENLQYINKIFQHVLSSDLSHHCYIAEATDKTITLIVDSPAWATRLRYSIPDIKKSLRIQPEFRNLQKIRYFVKTSLQANTSNKKTRKINKKDAGNAHELHETAKQIAKNKLAQ